MLEFEKLHGFTPRALLERPVMDPNLWFYRRAYDRLSRSRQWSDGQPQAIAISEIVAYCQGFGIQLSTSREALLDLVQAMDQVFMQKMAEQSPAEVKKAKSDVVTE